MGNRKRLLIGVLCMTLLTAVLLVLQPWAPPPAGDALSPTADQPETGSALLEGHPQDPLVAPVSPETVASPSDAGSHAGAWGAGNESWDDPALPKKRVPLEVEVVDRLGAPVPGAICRVGWGKWFTRDHVADARGQLTIQVPERSRVLEVRGQQGADNSHVYLFVHYHPLQPSARKTRVVVRGVAQTSGRVYGADSGFIRALRRRQPGREGEIAWLYASPQIEGDLAIAGDGSFVLRLPDDAPVDLIFEGKDENGPVYAVTHAVAPGTQDVRVVARSAEEMGRALRATVLHADGQPANGAHVTLSSVPTGHGRPPRPMRATLADSNGQASFDRLTAQVYWLRAASGNPGSVHYQEQTEAVVPGDREVVIQFRGKASRLRGDVRRPNGTPAAGAAVFATFHDRDFNLGETNEEGRFEIWINLSPGGTIQLFAAHPASSPTFRGYLYDCILGDPEWRIQLEEIGALTADESKAAVVARLKSVRHMLPTKEWRRDAEKGAKDRPKAAVDEGEQRLLTLLEEVGGIGTDPVRVRQAIRMCVRDWNKLNERHGLFMDTTAREELLAFFEQVAGAVGMDLPRDLLRDW